MREGNKTSSFNTSNLISHLRKNHSEVHAAFVWQSNAKQLGKDVLKKTTQLSLKESAEKKQNEEHPRAKAIGQKILEFIALDNQLFFHRARCQIQQTCGVPRAMLCHAQSQVFLRCLPPRIVQCCSLTCRKSNFWCCSHWGHEKNIDMAIYHYTLLPDMI